jgi:murein DD-endopeptidase MepM/ murein hydrolase activator NlpD
VIRHRIDRSTIAEGGTATGWASLAARRKQRRSRLLVALLALPMVLSMVVAPVNAPNVHGDELSDAKAKQAALKKQIADQKAKVQALNDLQSGLAAEIRSTKSDLRQIGADLNAVKKKITKMEAKIVQVQGIYDGLVFQLRYMDIELGRVTGQELAKRTQLTERRALLADRIRNAYDTERTSPLETFLSGGTFTDLLSEMSYYIDVAEQDKELAKQITRDQETLAALHLTVQTMRTRTDELRKETGAQKRALDAALVDLNETKVALRKLEKKVAAALRQQKARYAALARNKANAAAIIRRAAADQKKLSRQIEDLIKKQVQRGNIPSRYNGSMSWPMKDFTVSGNYGCSSFEYYAPGNGCAHYHNGIDLVGPSNTAIRASGPGVVVVCGWNWADGSDPAWIVVIAHSGNLRSWYAHMQPGCPAKVGDAVKTGERIGTQGSTGNSTGAHLHWMVEMNGHFVNPRLFL